MLVKYIALLIFFFLLIGCDDRPLNDPYPNQNPHENVLYTSFSERPKHLDPARSYSSNEWVITNQIYEPPLQYHYLKRPYTLETLTATAMPRITYIDKSGRVHDELAPSEVAYTVYEIQIKPNIFFQPHPAFAQNPKTNHYYYHGMTEAKLDEFDVLSDFAKMGTRELTAEDFVYQIKRIADPTLSSPVFGLMQNYIVGLDAFEQKLNKIYKKLGVTNENPIFLDFRQFPLEGAQVIDRYTYRIKILGNYPQFIYWLAMPFFAPMPWEAVKFYAQPRLIEKNITLDWYPVGTGPFMLSENNPNQRMILVRNPNFHGERYPSVTQEENSALLNLANAELPFLKEVIFTLETENIPYWNKFLQGYYDQSGVSSDSFDQALQSTGEGGLALTSNLTDKGIQLEMATQPTTFYWGFNMLDPIVGGYTEDKKKLRQAISIAMDIEEYIQIFLNGRAIAAQNPLPPGIFGFLEGRAGMNPYIYDFTEGTIKRKSITQAKQLLAEAGYKNGINPKTGQPLTLFLDATMGGGPDSQALYAWVRKQFQKLGIELVVRATQYNRFQEKIRTGNAQIFSWGWNADYPDPENFLFLLYGPNSKVHEGGENAVNYKNTNFDVLFEQMKGIPNGPQRLKIIQTMLAIIQADAPWVWGFHPKMYELTHAWVFPQKSNAMSRNTIKYIKIDPDLRAKKRNEWNKPLFWPLSFLIFFGIVLCIPAWLKYRKQVYSPPVLAQKKE